MRLFRYVLSVTLLVIIGVAFYYWDNRHESQVEALADGDQEIALIEPATSTDDWGRLVTALKLMEGDWPTINPTLPALRVNVAAAFPPLTAEVPEIILTFANAPKQKLRLRWYKISGEHQAASWVAKLHARARPPLAIIGGGTSNRAVALARALQETYPDPALPAPVFIITTATAANTGDEKPLIKEYPGRSFRFSFTNKRMVEALLKFTKQTPNLWLTKPPDAPSKHAMYALYWLDERYSKDLAELFDKEFQKRYPPPNGEFFDEGGIRYAVGDFFHPSPLEQDAIGTFISFRTPISPQSFLVLPTQTVRMRRMLINLNLRSPQDARNLVILNGDAISFNSVYRDRDVVWNIFDLPYSLVFFTHRNPIDRAAGFVEKAEERNQPADVFPQRTTTGTHDVLLYRDIFEALLYAVTDQGKLLGDALEVRKRLNATAWYHPPLDKLKDDSARVCNTLVHTLAPEPRRFFSDVGNRERDTGEHIVWVRPNLVDGRVDLTSKISVWSMIPNTKGEAWTPVVPPLKPVTYNQDR